jgi:putative ABC transport system substrate-binding protein
MSRPALLALAVGALALTACVPVWADSRVVHVGFLRAEAPDELFEPFRRGLQDLGYVEGSNLVLEQRWAHGRYEDLPRLAQELVELKVEVIFASCTPCALAARGASPTIPIVTVSGDPVAMGLATSLGRPGGNVTGFTLFLDEISVKRLEVLKEAVPAVERVVVLWVASNPFWDRIVERMSKAAPGLGMRVQTLKVLHPEDVGHALDGIAGQRIDALLVFEDPVLRDAFASILAFAAKHRIPAIYGRANDVRKGGLMSYGPSFDELFRRAAGYVDRILKGARPADLPIQQPSTFELAVNLTTAKALGITLPKSILLRADHVIR